MASLPIIKEIAWCNPMQILAIFSKKPGTLLLDSARLMPQCGRYSFLALDPFQTLRSKNGQIQIDSSAFLGDPFSVLEAELAKYSLPICPDLPPFQGGVAGYFGYELGQHLERLPKLEVDELQFPDLVLGFYDLVLGFDAAEQRAWIFSSGYPEMAEPLRRTRAEQRLQWLLQKITTLPALPEIPTAFCDASGIISNFTEVTYQAAVQKVIDYILAGDIFQANIAQCFTAPLQPNVNLLALYLRLRKLNPAPFSAFFNDGEVVLASASPERFLKLTNGAIETRPIKGTRPRGASVAADAKLIAELQQSEKDHAENVMIVDLLRNDLSRVCANHSVEVVKLCGIESYATVHHLVSVVTGKLKKECNAVDLLRATFPGGSITGAPKVHAMEIIAELEGQSRGPYSGSIGYIGFNGDMDLSIAIRTFAIKDGKITFQAGGGIVADSQPAWEYAESLAKAQALHAVLVGREFA